MCDPFNLWFSLAVTSGVPSGVSLLHLASVIVCFLQIWLPWAVSASVLPFLLPELSHHTVSREALSATCTPVPLLPRKLLLGLLLDIVLLWGAWLCRHGRPAQASSFSSV